MHSDIIIHIRGGMVAVATDRAGNPINATVRDFDIDDIPEDELLTDDEGDQYVEYDA